MADIQAFLDRVLSGGLQRTNRYRCKLDLADLFADQIGTTGGGVGTSDNPFRAGVEARPGLISAIELLKEGLLCRTTSTPTRELNTTSVNLAGGYDESYAISTTYNNLDCTFLCPLIGGETPGSTATNPVLSLFHAWQNLIQNRGTGGEDADMVLTFPREYRLAQGMRLELFTGRVPKNVHEAAARRGELEQLERNMPDLNPEHLAIMREGIANQGVVDNTRQISTAFEYFDVYPVTVSGTTVEWDMLDEMMEVTVGFSYTHWQQVKDGDLNL
jgi:hypothetical protein